MASKTSNKTRYFICPFCADTFMVEQDLVEHKDQCYDNPKNGGTEEGIFDLIQTVADDKDKQDLDKLQQKVWDKRVEIASRGVEQRDQQQEKRKELTSQGLAAEPREHKGVFLYIANKLSTVHRVLGDALEEGRIPIPGIPPVLTKMGKVYLYLQKSDKK